VSPALVRAHRGSPAPAATAVILPRGAPVAGRLAGRFGPSGVLLVTAGIHPIALVSLTLSARVAGPASAAIVVAAAASGATYPPLAAVLRSAWTGRRNCSITRWSASSPCDATGAVAVVRVDLSREDARILAALFRAAADPGGGTGPRGPIGLWIGSDEAAKKVGVEASTIRGWVACHGPRTHPFPPPGASYRGRNYWQRGTIERWQAEQRRLDEQHRASSGRSRQR
jgi:hypothetical protein